MDTQLAPRTSPRPGAAPPSLFKPSPANTDTKLHTAYIVSPRSLIGPRCGATRQARLGRPVSPPLPGAHSRFTSTLPVTVTAAGSELRRRALAVVVVRRVHELKGDRGGALDVESPQKVTKFRHSMEEVKFRKLPTKIYVAEETAIFSAFPAPAIAGLQDLGRQHLEMCLRKSFVVRIP